MGYVALATTVTDLNKSTDKRGTPFLVAVPLNVGG